MTFLQNLSDFKLHLWFWRKLDSTRTNFLTSTLTFWNVLDDCHFSYHKFSVNIRSTKTYIIPNWRKFDSQSVQSVVWNNYIYHIVTQTFLDNNLELSSYWSFNISRKFSIFLLFLPQTNSQFAQYWDCLYVPCERAISWASSVSFDSLLFWDKFWSVSLH